MSAELTDRTPCRPHDWEVPEPGDFALTCLRCGRVLDREDDISPNMSATIVNSIKKRRGDAAADPFKAFFGWGPLAVASWAEMAAQRHAQVEPQQPQVDSYRDPCPGCHANNVAMGYSLPDADRTFDALDLETGGVLRTYTLAGYDTAGGDIGALRSDAADNGDADLVAAIDGYTA